MPILKDSLRWLDRGWTNLTESLLGGLLGKTDIDLANGDEELLRRQLKKWLDARGGEVSARQHAMQIGRLYRNLSPAGKKRFLAMLAREFGIDRATLSWYCQAYLAPDADHAAVEQQLREVLVPPRLRLLRQFNTLPDGIKFLVDLRRDLIGFSREDPELQAFDDEIRHLLATWFDVGMLHMHQIDWQSPAAVLEKLVEYEAVHEIHSWQDLRHRLHLDRLCYAFFHPNMPGEPLIFVEVALTSGIAANIQTLLDESTPDVPPEKADTAIFYSISNAQQGLKGISFGNFLIKRVVDTLRAELPNIKTFATLSPIPGFRRWLDSLSSEEMSGHLGEERMNRLTALCTALEATEGLRSLLQRPDWYQQRQITDVLRPLLEHLLFHYFHTYREDGQPIDPVERFHLGNGARIERVNWLGDTSPRGLARSCGFMVNYLYPIRDIEKNHELYATRRKIVISSAVRSLGKEE